MGLHSTRGQQKRQGEVETATADGVACRWRERWIGRSLVFASMFDRRAEIRRGVFLCLLGASELATSIVRTGPDLELIWIADWDAHRSSSTQVD